MSPLVDIERMNQVNGGDAEPHTVYIQFSFSFIKENNPEMTVTVSPTER